MHAQVFTHGDERTAVGGIGSSLPPCFEMGSLLFLPPEPARCLQTTGSVSRLAGPSHCRSAGITDESHHIWCFMWILGINFRQTGFHSKSFLP